MDESAILFCHDAGGGGPGAHAVRSELNKSAEPEKSQAANQPQTAGQPSRVGKRSIAGHFAPEVARALRILAAENDRTVQQLLAEALNDLFVKYGGERIAEERPLPRGAAARKPTAPDIKESNQAEILDHAN